MHIILKKNLIPPHIVVAPKFLIYYHIFLRSIKFFLLCDKRKSLKRSRYVCFRASNKLSCLSSTNTAMLLFVAFVILIWSDALRGLEKSSSKACANVWRSGMFYSYTYYYENWCLNILLRIWRKISCEETQKTTSNDLKWKSSSAFARDYFILSKSNFICFFWEVLVGGWGARVLENIWRLMSILAKLIIIDKLISILDSIWD